MNLAGQQEGGNGNEGHPMPIGGAAAPAPADEELAGAPPVVTMPGSGAAGGANASGVKRSWLGFTPLEDKSGNGVRARKALSKKAVMKGMGADG